MNPARFSYHEGVVRWKLGKESVSAPGTEPESRVALGCLEACVDAGRSFWWGASRQAQVAENLDDDRGVFSGAGDVAAQPFELLSLPGATPCLRMKAKALRTHTALGIRDRWARRAQLGVFPCQHLLACSGPERNAVGTAHRMEWGQGGISIGVSQIRDLGVFFRERPFAGQHLQEASDDPRE